MFCSGNDVSCQSTNAGRRCRQRRWRPGDALAYGDTWRRHSGNHRRRGGTSRPNTDKVCRQTVDHRHRRGNAVDRAVDSPEFGRRQSPESPVIHQRTVRRREAGQRRVPGRRRRTTTEDWRSAVLESWTDGGQTATSQRRETRQAPDTDRRRGDQWIQCTDSANSRSAETERWSQSQGTSLLALQWCLRT